MIKENELLKAIGTYIENDLLPVIPDPKTKAAAVGLIAAIGIRPDFVSRLVKNAFPASSMIIEKGGLIDIESISAIAKEYMKNQKTISVKIPFLDSMDFDSVEINKIFAYAKQYEQEVEADE